MHMNYAGNACIEVGYSKNGISGTPLSAGEPAIAMATASCVLKHKEAFDARV